MNARRIRNPAVAYCVFAIAALASATVPLLSRAPRAMTAADASFPGWPTHFEGRPLTTLPLSERESAFSKDFPGHIGRFSDGRREIIVRYMSAPTRRLHPPANPGPGKRCCSSTTRRSSCR